MDSSFNHDLVLLIRQLKKISQADLARRANMTQGHLSKLENGLTEPSEETLKQLAKALEFPESFFNEPDRVYGLPISCHPLYRKKYSVAKGTIQSINAEINIRLMNLRRLLKSVDVEKVAFSVPRFDIDEHHGDIEEIAQLVRRAWMLPNGPLRNLTEFVEQAGCLVSLCDFSTNKIDGISFSIPDLPPCIFLNEKQPPDRLRFSLAHELGHLVLHHIPTPEMEDQADAFASAFLMPRTDIRSSFIGRLTLKRIAPLKPVWQVSIQALIMRASNIGMISENQAQYLWRQISSSGIRIQEPFASEIPYEKPKIIQKIFKIHVENLGYTLDDLSKLLHLWRSDILRLYPFLKGYQETQLRLVS